MSIFNTGFNQTPQFDDGSLNYSVVKIDNGAAYFVALAPVFSLFFEKISESRIAAIILWALTYVLCVFACKYDKNKILSKLYDTKSMGNYCFVPVAYLYKRSKLIRQKATYVYICIVTMFFALVSNGFVSFALADSETYITTVKTSEFSEFVDTKDIENYLRPTISEVLDKSLTSLEWNCETDKNDTEVTATGKALIDGESCDVSIVFYMWYDGFVFEGIDINEITINGVEAPENQYEKLFLDLYSIYSVENKENSNLVEV